MSVTRIRTNDLAANAVTPAKADLTGTWDFSSGTLRAASPSGTTDVAVKNTVDGAVQGLSPKASVRAATVGNITLSGAQTIDGVSVVAGNRVLVMSQTTGSENGIYVAASGAWSRSADLAAGASAAGIYCFVEEGTVRGDFAFVCPNDVGSDVVGTNALFFGKFSVNYDFQIENETPSGAINGVNAVFTLSKGPKVGSECVFKNGIRQRPGSGNDYTISGGTITFEAGNIPLTGDVLLVDYRA